METRIEHLVLGLLMIFLLLYTHDNDSLLLFFEHLNSHYTD